jgi:tellurite methyltransferase
MGARGAAFFDSQFRRQIGEREFALNPFEQAVLPYLQGRVLEFGCGLGNLAIAAARRGCSVVALDASRVAIDHIRETARRESLAIEASTADLRDYEIGESFDAAVSIGLLMFFDCETASRQIARLQERVRPGGIAAVNLLVEGTTYLDMFEPGSSCLFPRGELEKRFSGWEIVHSEHRDFPAPEQRVKSFDTLIARRTAIS